MLKSELARLVTPNSLRWELMGADDFVLTPLPNHLFQRDNSAWLYNGVSINPMAMPARMRESMHSTAIYRFHPMFAKGEFEIWYGGDDASHQPATLEGGDMHVLGNGAIMIGLGERSTPMGVENLARSLFAKGAANKIIAIELPHSHAMMHLDTVMTMIDRTTFVMYPYLKDDLRSWTVLPDTDDGRVEGRAEPRPVRHDRRDARRRQGHGAARPTRTSGPRSASSGTTAATSWPSSPGSSSATSATSPPTPTSASTASRWSPSPAANSAVAAAVPGA